MADPQEIVNHFNSVFCNIGPGLGSKTYQPENSDMELPSSNSKSMFLTPT